MSIISKYNRPSESVLRNIDWFTVILYLVLISLGWLSIYSATSYNTTSSYNLSSRAEMQLVWIGTSFIIAFILLKLDADLYDIFAYYIYIAFMLLLLITIFIAPDIKGSRSWLVITNNIRVQPAEFAKFAVALALSKFMSQYKFNLMTAKNLTICGLILFIPFILIIFQQETGSALVFSAFILVFYREGLPSMVLVLFVTATLLFIFGLKYSDIDVGYTLSMGEFLAIVIISVISILILFNSNNIEARVLKIVSISVLVYYGLIFLLDYLNILTINLGLFGIIGFTTLILYFVYLSIRKWNSTYLIVIAFMLSSMVYVSSIDYIFTDVMQPHQQQRIKITLGIEDDPLGVGYNQNQSKISIGSGGIFGKGFLNATQTKLKYVPEHDTDFIFCTVGEEHGLLGSSIVLIIFLVFILRIVFLAERQKSNFTRIYGYCVASIFFFHICINIGMVLGITPVIGIPLPFFSYGGSSAWAFTILLFIFLRLDMVRKRRY